MAWLKLPGRTTLLLYCYSYNEENVIPLKMSNHDTDFMMDLNELECREFQTDTSLPDTSGFAVKKCGKVFAYLNSCPHTGAPLNWQENQFLDLSKTHILCSIHGARFRIENGLCIEGPCKGQMLKRIRQV